MLLLLMTTTAACFTGVESTPTIGSRDIKKHVSVTAEQKYFDDVYPEPISQWSPGKKFLVTDSRIDMIFQPGTIAANLHMGDILTFESLTEATSPTGSAVDIIFSTPSNPSLQYRVNAPLHEVTEREEVEIPFTVELDIADKVRDRLIDKTFYIVTPRWYDSAGNPVTRKKFVPVVVSAVEPGNFDFPVKVSFSPVPTEANRTYSVYMSVGNGTRSTRNFDTLFSLTDPHERYQSITDDTWQAIIEGRIMPGMTRDEARLSLGSPKEVDRGHDYSSVYEKWTYDGGVYLIFRDNILESYRR